MKLFISLLILFLMFFCRSYAAEYNVLVLPAELLETKENYYGFDEVSEIIVNDIIRNFNSSNKKIESPDLYTVRTKLNSSSDIKKITQDALSKYKLSGKIDFDSLKKIGNYFSCKSVLLIYSGVVTNKCSSRRGVWEILEVSTNFKLTYPYGLQTSVILLDTVNDIIMWSNNYSTKLGSNNNLFTAKNYVEANEQLEKIKLYSANILSASITQNIMLRFFPKTIRPLSSEIDETSGGAIRYDSKIPQLPEKNKLDEQFYGEMLYGL